MMINSPPASRILTVSQLTRSVKGLLETEFPFITVTGEISNLRRPFSGHLYFTLKDEGAQLKSVLFKTQQRYLAFNPADGQQVICRGRLSVYEPRGDYQLIVDYLEEHGAGALRYEFEQLKKKLAAAGLFDREHKRRLPLFPEKIALITSPRGAAIHDFLQIAAVRFAGLAVEIMPVRVQGDGAAQDICQAIAAVNDRGTASVIVLCRGGGSLEDLRPFNEETVARAIYDSRIPVVSAVGHEIDFTISDLAADVRAATPSSAAEMVIPDRYLLQEKIAELKRNMARAVKNKLVEQQKHLRLLRRLLRDPGTLLSSYLLRVDHLQSMLCRAMERDIAAKARDLDLLRERLQRQDPAHLVDCQRRRLLELGQRLQTGMHRTLQQKAQSLKQSTRLLESMSPRAVLARGYAVARTSPGKRIIRRSKDTVPGQALELLVQEGKIHCEVTGAEE